MAIIETGSDPVVRVAGRGATAIGYIVPAATFTATTPSDGTGGKTVLTSAGAHGLTSAVAVGKHLYISAGTNWTPGFYPITAIDLDTTGVAVTITYTYSASLGTPTIALANTEVTFVTVTIPSLRANSYLKIDGTWSYTGSVNTKVPIVRWNNNLYYQPSVTTGAEIKPAPIIIQNRGSTNSQKGGVGNISSSYSGTSSTTGPTSSIDTSVSTSVTLGGKVVTANEVIYLERYYVEYVL